MRDLAAFPNIRPSSSWTEGEPNLRTFMHLRPAAQGAAIWSTVVRALRRGLGQRAPHDSSLSVCRGAMSITGRIWRWVLPGVLCCGGCATHPLVEATPAVAQQAVDAGVATGGTVAQPVATSEQDARAVDANREAASAPVPAEPGVGREADTAPSAYADLCRQTATGPSDSASRPTADEGVALSPLMATPSTPSPASSEASPVATPARAANVADTRTARPATSVFSPAAASRGEQASPPAGTHGHRGSASTRPVRGRRSAVARDSPANRQQRRRCFDGSGGRTRCANEFTGDGLPGRVWPRRLRGMNQQIRLQVPGGSKSNWPPNSCGRTWIAGRWTTNSVLDARYS